MHPIIKFSSRRAKERVIESREMLETNPPKESNGVPIHVYTANGITKSKKLRRASLAYQARHLKRADRIIDTWLMDYKICVKDRHNRIHPAKSTKDLRKF